MSEAAPRRRIYPQRLQNAFMQVGEPEAEFRPHFPHLFSRVLIGLLIVAGGVALCAFGLFVLDDVVECLGFGAVLIVMGVYMTWKMWTIWGQCIMLCPRGLVRGAGLRWRRAGGTRSRRSWSKRTRSFTRSFASKASAGPWTPITRRKSPCWSGSSAIWRRSMQSRGRCSKKRKRTSERTIRPGQAIVAFRARFGRLAESPCITCPINVHERASMISSPHWRLFSSPLVAVLFMVFSPAGRAAAQGVEQVKADLHEVRIPHSDARRQTPLHRRLRRRRTRTSTYPILMTRTPYSVKPYGVDQYRDRPRPLSTVRQGGLHLRLPGRARPLDVRGRVRQHAAAQPGQEGAKDVDESTDTYDTIDWLAQARARTTTARSASGASPIPASTPSAGMIDAHPAPEGRLAAGPRHRLVHRRRLAPQRRALPAAHVQLHGPIRQAPPRADARSSTRTSTTKPRTATTSS